MRDVIFAVLTGIGVLAICLWTAAMLLSLQPPEAHAQPHNPYWPYTVELQVRDR